MIRVAKIPVSQINDSNKTISVARFRIHRMQTGEVVSIACFRRQWCHFNTGNKLKYIVLRE